MSNTTLTPEAGALGLEQQLTDTPTTGAIGFAGAAGAALLGMLGAPVAAALAITGNPPVLSGRAGVATGTLALQGNAPSVQSGGAKTITPPAGALAVTTQGLSPVIAPPAGVLSIVGNALVSNTLIAPPAGVLLFSPQSSGGTVIPSTGSLNLVGAVPTEANSVLTPPAGSLSADGQVPPQILSVQPPQRGSVAFASSPPTVSISANSLITPNPGALAASGQGPFAATGLATKSGALALVAAAPQIDSGDYPSTGNLSFAGIAAVPIAGTVIVPPAGALSAPGNGPRLGATLITVTGSLAAAGNSPVSSFGPVITPVTGALGVAGAAPTVSTPQSITPASGALSIVGNTQLGAITISPPAGALQLSSAPPISAEQNSTQAGALSFAGAAPVLRLTIAPPAGQLASSSSSPTLTASFVVTPPAGSLAAAGTPSPFTVGTSPVPATDTMALNTSAPVITQTFNGYVLPQAGSVGLAGNVPHTLQTVPTSTVFRDIVLLRAPIAGASLQAGPLPFGAAYQSIGEQIPYGIDWEDWLALRWQEGTQVSAGQVIRPSIPNGYELICSVAGETGSFEPGWPPFNGSTVLDGSAQWQVQPLSNDSLEATVADVSWSANVELGLSGNVLAGQTTIITVDTTNAEVADYFLKCTVSMSDGQQKVGTIIVKVR